MKGVIVTIEGSDGSGKKTQARLLIERAKKEGYKTEALSFPDYTSFWGKVIGLYLKGNLGSLGEIDPKHAAMLYALDRLDSKDKILKWMAEGKNIIFDRYIESNYGHQAGKFKGKAREDMVKWIYDIEVVKFGLPPSTIVIYLDLPVEYSLKAMEGRQRGYLSKGEKDIHESDKQHLIDTQETYKMVAKRNKNWFVINCLDAKNQRRTPEDLAEEIWELVKPQLVR